MRLCVLMRSFVFMRLFVNLFLNSVMGFGGARLFGINCILDWVVRSFFVFIVSVLGIGARAIFGGTVLVQRGSVAAACLPQAGP